MKHKQYLLGLGLGFAIGYVTKTIIHDTYKKVSPEKALQYAKATFKKNGPVSSTWIDVQPRRLKLNGLIYQAYRGGVSRHVDGESRQYDFYSDLETGAILLVEESEK